MSGHTAETAAKISASWTPERREAQRERHRLARDAKRASGEVPWKDKEKPYNAARQRSDREAARQAFAHQCEHAEDCPEITTVRWVRGKGYQPNRFCQRHAGVQPVQVVDARTGQLDQIPGIRAAHRHQTYRSRHVTTPEKTKRTRRQQGWHRGPARKQRENAEELAEQMRSPAMRLSGRLGVIWRQAGLSPPPLTRLTDHRDVGKPKGAPRHERLPADPYQLLELTAAVRRARIRGTTFVRIGQTIGLRLKWHCYRDRYGNVTKCDMASKLYRFSLALDERLPDWMTTEKTAI